MVVHLTLIPYLNAAGELKTKPTQHSVKSLLELGVQPDVLVCRTEQPLTGEIKRKLALFCNVQGNAVIEARDLSTIYEVPMAMLKEKLDKVVLRKLSMSDDTDVKLSDWNEFLFRLKNPKSEVNIGLIGKYVELRDANKSISESFIHSGAENECKVNVSWIHSEDINETSAANMLGKLDGILVAPL